MADLNELIEDLVFALEKRETVEPDVAAWEAEAEIRVIQQRLLGEFRPGRTHVETPPGFERGGGSAVATR